MEMLQLCALQLRMFFFSVWLNTIAGRHFKYCSTERDLHDIRFSLCLEHSGRHCMNTGLYVDYNRARAPVGKEEGAVHLRKTWSTNSTSHHSLLLWQLNADPNTPRLT